MSLIEQGNPDPEFLASTFGALTCGLLSKSFGLRFPAVLEHTRRFGVADILAVNGVDPSLRGVFINGHLPDRKPLSVRTRAMWSRVAAHLAAAYRLRRRLASLAKEPAGREAVLLPSGTLEHAEGAAKEREARPALRQSVLRLEKARGKMRREEPDRAMDAWKGLVEARWTLLSQFESNGRRYVVARTNESPTPSLEVLSPRERQVVAFVALGHTDKHVAYELGLAASTVRVLLARAARKLGARSRLELIQAVRRRPPS